MRSGESAVEGSEILGSLRVAQVLRLPSDTVTGVPGSVSDWDVEHVLTMLHSERLEVDILDHRGCIFPYGATILWDGPFYRSPIVGV
jgi:hypothetical protein